MLTLGCKAQSELDSFAIISRTDTLIEVILPLVPVVTTPSSGFEPLSGSYTRPIWDTMLINGKAKLYNRFHQLYQVVTYINGQSSQVEYYENNKKQSDIQYLTAADSSVSIVRRVYDSTETLISQATSSADLDELKEFYSSGRVKSICSTTARKQTCYYWAEDGRFKKGELTNYRYVNPVTLKGLENRVASQYAINENGQPLKRLH